MDYFENTTRITEDGYAAILQMQKKQHCIICRAIGILLAIYIGGGNLVTGLECIDRIKM